MVAIQNSYFEGYEIDFFLPAYNLAIEVDGFSHLSTVKRRSDERKDQILETKGITVFRITNQQLLANPATCLADVEDYIRRFKAAHSQQSINQEWKKGLITTPLASKTSKPPQTIEEYFLSLEEE